MTTDRPELFDVINEAIQGALGAMRVVGIGVVNGYDPKGQSATISSTVSYCYWDDEEEELRMYKPAAIPNVPVMHMSAGGFFSAMPVNSGDFGVILTADRAISDWKSSGSTSNEPRDGRRFNIQDSLFLPMGQSFANPIQNLDITNEHWVWGEDTELGFRFRLGEGKFEFGTPLVRVLQQISDAISYAGQAAGSTGSSVVTTLMGPQPLSNAAQLASVALSLAQIQALIETVRGD